MYDAIEDPYTYKNSTVLVNKLDLQNQAELDAFGGRERGTLVQQRVAQHVVAALVAEQFQNRVGHADDPLRL